MCNSYKQRKKNKTFSLNLDTSISTYYKFMLNYLFKNKQFNEYKLNIRMIMAIRVNARPELHNELLPTICIRINTNTLKTYLFRWNSIPPPQNTEKQSETLETYT